MRARGNYKFSNLVAGDYVVMEVPLSDYWVQTWPTTDSGTYPVTLGISPDLTGLDFGDWESGSLTLTKAVDISTVIDPSGISQDFTVTVTGPSYPSGHDIVFHLVSDVLQSPQSVTLDNLLPGKYTVSESPGFSWSVSVTGSITVNPGQTTPDSVTNTLKLGSGGLTLGFWSNKNGQA